MSTVLVILGVVCVIAGLVWFFLPAPQPGPAAEGLGDELSKVLGELNKMFDKFDKRFRPGVLMMIVGLALIGLGVYLEAQEAKDAANAAAVLFVSPRLLRLRLI